MPFPINLAQGFFNLTNPDPLSQFTGMVTGNINLPNWNGPTSGFTNSTSLNNPTLFGELWSQGSQYITLPGINIPPEALAVIARIPLPSNFTSRVPSTYGIIYPMPTIPGEFPSLPADSVGEPDGAADSSLSKFIAEVKNRDFAFKSKYKVALPTTVGSSDNPQSLVQDLNMDGPVLSLYCDGAELPGVAVGTKSFRIYGPSFERPGSISYGGEAIQLVFLVDQEFNVRKYFETWIQLVSDPVTYSFNYPSSYLSSGIVITQLKHRGEDMKASQDVGVYSVRLLDAFPKAIAGMGLSYGDRDMHRIAVTFAYSKWVPIYGNDEPPFNYNDGAADYVITESPNEG